MLLLSLLFATDSLFQLASSELCTLVQGRLVLTGGIFTESDETKEIPMTIKLCSDDLNIGISLD